jgi:cold shock CspA family protein
MVKWFNNKSGFGFITVCGEGEPYSGKDIFVHYTSIRVSDTQYKYLVQGEYVDFSVVDSENDAHEYQATDVCGVKGGSIMCETRRAQIRDAPQPQQQQHQSQRPHRHAYVRVNDEPVSPKPTNRQPTQVDGDGFTRVQKRRQLKAHTTNSRAK